MIARGQRIVIAERDRVGGTGPLELLLTEVPSRLHPGLEWVRIKGVEIEGETAMDVPVSVVIRASVLRRALEG